MFHSNRNVPQLQESSTATGMFHSSRNISRNVFKVKIKFLKFGPSFMNDFSISSHCFTKYMKLIKKNMVVLRDLCCQTYPRAATPVRPWIRPQD